MIEAVKAKVPRITPERAQQLMSAAAPAVAVRDAPELEKSGKGSGAGHVSRRFGGRR
jgi:hypothetical protein